MRIRTAAVLLVGFVTSLEVWYPKMVGFTGSVPYGTNPHSPYVFGYHESNHDEAYTTNSQVDVPF